MEFLIALQGMAQGVSAVLGPPAVGALLVWVLIDLCKRFGWVKNNYAGMVNGYLNLAIWLGLFGARALGLESDFLYYLTQAGTISFAAYSFIGSVMGAKLLNEIFKMVGFAFSYEPFEPQLPANTDNFFNKANS